MFGDRGRRVEAVTGGSTAELCRGRFTLVLFFARWDAGCLLARDSFRRVATASDPALRFAACDVDKAPALARTWGVQVLPTLAVLAPNGEEIDRHVGVWSRHQLADLVSRVAAFAALDPPR